MYYSARQEILKAALSARDHLDQHDLSKEHLTEELFSTFLETKGIPDPELLVRTSGECRISNFLLWQLSYTEMVFTETHWPEFRREEFLEAILKFQKRERRFGLVSEQIQTTK